MSDNNDSFHDDDYLWDVDNGYIRESGGGSFKGLRITIIALMGIFTLANIAALLGIDLDDMPAVLYFILLVGICWLWNRIVKLL